MDSDLPGSMEPEYSSSGSGSEEYDVEFNLDQSKEVEEKYKQQRCIVDQVYGIINRFDCASLNEYDLIMEEKQHLLYQLTKEPSEAIFQYLGRRKVELQGMKKKQSKDLDLKKLRMSYILEAKDKWMKSIDLRVDPLLKTATSTDDFMYIQEAGAKYQKNQKQESMRLASLLEAMTTIPNKSPKEEDTTTTPYCPQDHQDLAPKLVLPKPKHSEYLPHQKPHEAPSPGVIERAVGYTPELIKARAVFEATSALYYRFQHLLPGTTTDEKDITNPETTSASYDDEEMPANIKI